jgi:hypothetical protein
MVCSPITSSPVRVDSPARRPAATLPPALIRLGGLAELFITLGTDLLYASARSETYWVEGRRVGTTVQSWHDREGEWVKVVHLHSEMSVAEIQRVLRLRDHQRVILGGARFWESTLDDGLGGVLMWVPEPGVTVYVGASQKYRCRLHQIGVRLERIK